MQYSTNYNLNLVEGTDIVNPLVIDKPNYQTIDGAMKANKDAAVNAATHTKAGTVHAIVRTNTDANVFRFVASAPFTAGDTFTVDGNAVTGINTAGEGLETNDFVIGASVLCVLNSGTLTLNVNKNVAIPATYDADDIVFDNTGTGIVSTNVQGALEEIDAITSGNVLSEDIGSVVVVPGPLTTIGSGFNLFKGTWLIVLNIGFSSGGEGTMTGAIKLAGNIVTVDRTTMSGGGGSSSVYLASIASTTLCQAAVGHDNPNNRTTTSYSHIMAYKIGN